MSEWDEEYERERAIAHEAMASWREAVAEATQKFATVTKLREARDIVNNLRDTADKLGDPWSEIGVTISDLAATTDLTPEQYDLLVPLHVACSGEYVVFANQNGVVMVSPPDDYETDIMTWAAVADIVKAHA